MRTTIFRWLGKEFVSFSAEARPEQPVAEQTKDLFRCVEAELKDCGLSMENTVRTRIWGADREARNVATAARADILTGRRKAASSSYVSAGRFDSDAKVALDLLAMVPSHPRATRSLVEFEPTRNYLRFLQHDNVVFVSGFTSELDGQENQAQQVWVELDDALRAASSRRGRIVNISVFLDRNQRLEKAKELLTMASTAGLCAFELERVDGFAREKSLLEVEVTALTGPEQT
jgi:enamine deaminase RidA (YjgF/YER057c/UK114 family)